ncbi:hypothetical protein [Arthrobacter sp. YN]|uniref:hypothetical protein n=1 Tax=Arthrobacter sp. YN TaxID=2020486 RepID=UPI000B5E1C85|nr:hypothetical protein [Arthrobacter sp. YN]ASN20662.1 hypothetical protein CGK93_13980 [Arthrobacter sp. YN]
MSADIHQTVLAALTEVAETEDFLTVVAAAVTEALTTAGYFKAAGTEYAIRRGTVIEEIGFNTEGQAMKWAETHLPKNTLFEIPKRPVGVWQ